MGRDLWNEERLREAAFALEILGRLDLAKGLSALDHEIGYRSPGPLAADGPIFVWSDGPDRFSRRVALRVPGREDREITAEEVAAMFRIVEGLELLRGLAQLRDRQSGGGRADESAVL